MNQKRKYKTYSKEFKEEAVSLVNDQGYSVSEAAEAVGVNPNQIYNWKNQQEEQVKGTLLNDNERTELIKLRAENKRLKMEKDILKKDTLMLYREAKRLFKESRYSLGSRELMKALRKQGYFIGRYKTRTIETVAHSTPVRS